MLNAKFYFIHICQDIGKNDPMFEGGDCEDWAQTYMQVLHNIYQQLPALSTSVKSYFPNQNADVYLNDVFGIISTRSLQVYLARGIYYDDYQNDQNHTFSVAHHCDEESCSFSVIENVVPTFVIENHEDCENVAEKFLSITSTQQVYTKNCLFKYVSPVWLLIIVILFCSTGINSFSKRRVKITSRIRTGM